MKQKLTIFFIFVTIGVFSQEVTKDHYKSAVSFMYDNYNNKTAFNLFTTPNWFKDGSGLWYVDHSNGLKTYKKVEFRRGRSELLFNHKILADRLFYISDKDVKPFDLELTNIQKIRRGLQFDFEGKTYTVDLNSYKIRPKENEEKEDSNPDESKSPDGKWIAFTKNYNLYIRSTESGAEFKLSLDGEKGFEYATWYGWYDKMEGENGERPKRFFVDWSEDSKWISTSVVDFRNAEKMYLLDWSIDSLYKPKLLSYYRGSPGDTTMVHVKPVFFNVESKREVKTSLPSQTHINSVEVQWTERSGRLIASIPERGYLKRTIKLIDLNSKLEEVLLEEESNTGLDNFEYRVIDNRILFLSERSGWRQLYLYNFNTKQTKMLTKDGFYVNKIEYVDDEERNVYYSASGKEDGENPYHQKLYRINFNGYETLLTPEPGHHIINFSKDGKYFVDNFSTITNPTKTVLRAVHSGRMFITLATADISQIEARGYQFPEEFKLVGKDGESTIYGAFWRPTNFSYSKKYPIIDATYTGPHTQRFPKSFNRIFDEQSLAELGFIVVRIDGLGTSGRSKEFHDHSYKNMGNNLEDHVLAIKYLAEKYPFIDVNRVGIYGHSAGGYDTGRAMLAYPDFYKVGVASSADHDFRMEKAWWPEMYQGWPVDETYEEVSNITNASNLKGKLMLTHGGIDDNVNPSATFKLAEALINADKEFDLVIFPSQRHGYQGKSRKYFIKKRWNYFVKHLLGAEPVWEFEWE